ncbi:MAG: DUF1822 family protein [Oscillatoria sp. SIO1A7]|nr:DUF1822 family protein [Oscillatoria sp. SIO1A7]
MNYTVEPLTFSVPLSAGNYSQARKFSRLHQNPDKARQVYLNTLAVQAVSYYCLCLEIDADLAASDSWQPAMQALMDVADLEIKNWGKLECRPVLPGAVVCQVPEEVCCDRVGYVVVEIDEAAKKASLLGFAKTVPTGRLPLSELASLEELINAMPEEPA